MAEHEMEDFKQMGIPPALLSNPPQSDNYASEHVASPFEPPPTDPAPPPVIVSDARCPRCDSTLLPYLSQNQKVVLMGCPVCKAGCTVTCAKCEGHPNVLLVATTKEKFVVKCDKCDFAAEVLRDPPVKHIGEAMKQSEGKLRFDLIDPLFEEGLASCLEYGARKYDDWNWLKGKPISFYYAAMRRHLNAWWLGEDIDPESKLHHLDHAACNLMFLRRLLTKEQWDDRVFRK